MSLFKSKRRERWLAVLLCVNLVLVTILAACHFSLPQANAQLRSRTTSGEYLLIPGRFRRDRQVVWVMDVRNSLLTNCLVDKSRLLVQVGEVLDVSERMPVR